MKTIRKHGLDPRAFSPALAAALALAACSGSDPRAEDSGTGKELFRVQACATCHGDHGQGSMLAPALTAAHTQWTRETLVQYLNDPQGYAAKDARLSKQGTSYFQPMPTYKMLKPEERASLAEYVLSLR
jgi:mono/diheme cytochrome c family protein